MEQSAKWDCQCPITRIFQDTDRGRAPVNTNVFKPVLYAQDSTPFVTCLWIATVRVCSRGAQHITGRCRWLWVPIRSIPDPEVSFRDAILFRCLVGPWCNFYPAGVIFAAHAPSHLDAYEPKKAVQALWWFSLWAGSAGSVFYMQM